MCAHDSDVMQTGKLPDFEFHWRVIFVLRCFAKETLATFLALWTSQQGTIVMQWLAVLEQEGCGFESCCTWGLSARVFSEDSGLPWSLNVRLEIW